MQDQDIVLIPLRARDGAVRAYAIVDAGDADWVNQWRWCLNNGYVGRRATRQESGSGPRRLIYLHRALGGLMHGDEVEVDHFDLDHLNNRRKNLRIVTHAQNGQNHPGWQHVTSEHRGVSFDTYGSRWRAKVHVRGRQVYLGSFRTEEEAAQAAREGRRRLMTHATN